MAAFSASVLVTKYGPPKIPCLLTNSTSVQQLSSIRPDGPGVAPRNAAERLEVYTTRLTVLASMQACRMACRPVVTRLIFTSSGSDSWKSSGWATWKSPIHPSIAGLKVSGLSRSALKICSLSEAPATIDKVHIPIKTAREDLTEPGKSGHTKGPCIQLGTTLTTSNPCFSPKSRAALSVSVFETQYELPYPPELLTKSTSLQKPSSTKLPEPISRAATTVDALDVYTTRLTVLESRDACNMPSVALTDSSVMDCSVC
ncbi:tetratricopeptide repeat protein [Striga asiatica]|uniref:Tetratricopeptide repeat protein n=1 Tax=Striga asiatica TaxID=4170 RepID=A0A5A7PES3_STRAF|nr:tetratricopeptide repeat protein [Striga asiatica]